MKIRAPRRRSSVPALGAAALLALIGLALSLGAPPGDWADLDDAPSGDLVCISSTAPWTLGVDRSRVAPLESGPASPGRPSPLAAPLALRAPPAR
jgi:hypothetical protein